MSHSEPLTTPPGSLRVDDLDGHDPNCLLIVHGWQPPWTCTCRCPACHGVGWYLDYSGGGHSEPLTLELLPCIQPECGSSGQRIEHLSVNDVGFNRVSERGGLVMAVGRG